MKITHPVDGYSGHVRVGDYAVDFLAGTAHDTNIPRPARSILEDEGFAFEDDRPGRGDSDVDDSDDELDHDSTDE